MKKLFLVVLVITLAACSNGSMTDLSRNQQLWDEANISHYQFSLTLSCFCAFRDQMPLTIEVNDGAVVSMTDANGVAISANDPNYEFFVQYASIDNIFLKLNEATSNPEAGDVTVTYAPGIGYPMEAYIDFIALAVDDEMGLTVSEFEQLP